MNPQLWIVFRYVLIGIGGFLAGKGYVTADQWAGVVDALPAAVGAVMAAATALWGLYVRFGTRAVPKEVADKPSVPVVSPATGRVQSHWLAGLAALALAVVLAGCQTTGEGPKTQVVRDAVATVQDYTRKACGFIPVASTVNALLVRNDVASDIIGLASQICAAVTLNPMTEGPRGGRTVPKIKGIPIRGQFV